MGDDWDFDAICRVIDAWPDGVDPGEGSTKPGVYAVFLKKAIGMKSAGLDTPCLIYIGKAEKSLPDRYHNEHLNSGWSTLRRSVGAVLRKTSPMKAVPRLKRDGSSDRKHFCFDDEGLLTGWMHAHLEYRRFPVTKTNIRPKENRLIRHYDPPLNLTISKNCVAKRVRALRAECAAEARSRL